MAYPPPQGNFGYQSAYPTVPYSSEPYPPPIGFQHFIEPDPRSQAAYPARDPPSYPNIVHHDPAARKPKADSSSNVPDVGFERFSRGSQRPSAQSASAVELKNVEKIDRDNLDEPQSDNSQTRLEVNSQPRPLYCRDGRRKIDYILAYQEYPDKPLDWQEKRKEKRQMFEENLKAKGLELEQEDFEASKDGKTVYIKVHTPWDVLAKEAEEMMMRMPTEANDVETQGFIDKALGCVGLRNPFDISESEVPSEQNYFTCAFKRDRLDKYRGHENKETFFSNSQRSLIVYRILKSTPYDADNKKIGVDRLVSNLSYNAAYPLHEGHHKPSQSPTKTDRQTLYHVWGKFKRFSKKQPLKLIRKYFGEKIGIYFAWLGFYTILLFPAAIVGVVNVIYGLARLNNYIPTNIICNETLKNKYAMCPSCDKKCDYFPLYDTCTYARAAYVFDNEFTVVFAVFMSLWSTMFLEFWKRRQVEIAYAWDLLGFEEEEESIRPEYEAVCTETRNNAITDVQEPYYPGFRKCPRFLLSGTSVLFMICLVVSAVFGVIVYRVAVFASLTAAYDSNISNISITVTATAAVINLVIILFLSVLYEKLAYFLTDLEIPRTQSDYEDSFTIKMYLFQFVNYYSSLFYIAFAKLNPGRPGDYHRIFGFRQEECNAAGCLIELTIQLAIIMVGKQIFNAAMEIFIPKIMNWWNRRDNFLKKFRGEQIDDQAGPVSNLQWESDYYLTPMPRNALFYEYLEMVIQFGFITIFVTAFPLGPLFALINNLFEIRLDAYKFITTYRRPWAARAEDIGIWYSILKGIAIFSVVVNGFVIAFVSEFIPRTYFQVRKGKDGSLEGYLDTSLSCFDIRDYPIDEIPKSNFSRNFEKNGCGLGLESCRYRGYREKPMSIAQNPYGNLTNGYDFSKDYWHILSAQLFFVIAFLLVVFGLTFFLAYVIPDRPKKLDNRIKREAFLAKKILRTDHATVES